MRARELVDKYRDKVIKLSYGSGFIYCGKVDDGLIKLLKRADKVYIRMAENNKESAITRREKAINELEKLPEKIKGMEEELEKLKASLEMLKDKLDNEEDKELQKLLCEEIKDHKENIVIFEGDEKHEGSINMAKRRMVHLKKLIPFLKKSIDGAERYIREYQSFTVREVKEEYHSIDYMDVCPIDMIVICDGCESGKYWTVKEYMTDTERPY